MIAAATSTLNWTYGAVRRPKIGTAFALVNNFVRIERLLGLDIADLEPRSDEEAMHIELGTLPRSRKAALILRRIA